MVLPPRCRCPTRSTSALYDPIGWVRKTLLCSTLGDQPPSFGKWIEPKWILAVNVTPAMPCGRSNAMLTMCFDPVTCFGRYPVGSPAFENEIGFARSGTAD